MEKIVIIGGGFAGLNLVKRLDPEKYRISLVDRNNFHCFPPLFYQIASSGLVSANICFPFRREIKKMKNVSYHMGHVKQIDIAAKKVTTSYETRRFPLPKDRRRPQGKSEDGACVQDRGIWRHAPDGRESHRGCVPLPPLSLVSPD